MSTRLVTHLNHHGPSRPPAKHSVRLCIHNLQMIMAEAPGPLLAEVAVAVLGFVADSYSLGPALFLEFEANGGYMAVENILKR